MPETKVRRRAATRKTQATRKRAAAASRKRQPASAVDGTAKLSDEVLKSLEAWQLAAINAVNKFVETVDEKLPAVGDGHPSRRQEIVDAALEMSDRLVRAQYDFLHKAVDNAGKALSRADGVK